MAVEPVGVEVRLWDSGVRGLWSVQGPGPGPSDPGGHRALIVVRAALC